MERFLMDPGSPDDDDDDDDDNDEDDARAATNTRFFEARGSIKLINFVHSILV